MGPWDDVEVDADGGELLDWLWDFPERYDVGDESEPSGAVRAVESGVRKHIRRPAGLDPTVVPTPPPAYIDELPTAAMDPVDPFDDGRADGGYVAAYPGFVDEGAPRSRITARDLAAVAAVIVVVAAGILVGYNLFKGSAKTAKPSNLAVAGPTTTQFVPVVIPPVDTTPSSVETTTSLPPSTTLFPSSSVPAVLGAASTTTTTRRATTTTTRPPTTTTTTTTTMPTTTTSSSTSTSTSTSTSSTSAPTSTSTSTSLP